MLLHKKFTSTLVVMCSLVSIKLYEISSVAFSETEIMSFWPRVFELE